MNKFGAIKTTLDGIDFASQAEANRYAELKLLERAREIRALSCHPRYPLTINGITIGVYTADFCFYEGGRKICEDVKGKTTPEASLRLRVFRALYPDIELRIHHKGQSRTLKQRAVAA
jgi:hypothetical protein